jgi:hypothetical protein
LLVSGASEEEILTTLHIDHAQLRKLEETLYSNESHEIASEKTDRTFAKYRIDQRRNIKALDELISELDGNTQYNAVVGAIRLRADLQDRIIKTGQELGCIKKAATETHHTHAVAVAISQMSAGDLRTEIKKMGASSQEKIERYSDKPFLELPEAPMYYGDAVKELVKPPAKSSPNPEPAPERKRTKKRKLPGRRGLHI